MERRRPKSLCQLFVRFLVTQPGSLEWIDCREPEEGNRLPCPQTNLSWQIYSFSPLILMLNRSIHGKPSLTLLFFPRPALSSVITPSTLRLFKSIFLFKENGPKSTKNTHSVLRSPKKKGPCWYGNITWGCLHTALHTKNLLCSNVQNLWRWLNVLLRIQIQWVHIYS